MCGNTRDSRGCTFLMRMVPTHEEAFYSVLGLPGLDMHAQSPEGWTALSVACRDQKKKGVGMLKLVRVLVEALGADVIVRHATGGTLVMLAVLSGRTEVLAYLLGRRFHGMIDLEAKGKNGHTALMLACKDPDTLAAAVELLLQGGADPRKNEVTGHCPLALVIGEEDQKKKSLIVAARAEPERARQLHKVRYLLERMPEPERRTTTTITTTIVTPKPVVTVGRHGKRKRKRKREEVEEEDEVAEEEGEEEGRLVGVIEYVVGRDGSWKKRMLDAHFLELMDMMLPPWDAERTRA